MYTKRVGNKEQLTGIIESWSSVGYKIANRGTDWVVLRKQTFGSAGIHIILFFLTWMIIWIPNIIYALYSYYLKKEEWMFIIEGSPIPNDIEISRPETKPVNNNKSGISNRLLIVILVAIVIVWSVGIATIILFNPISSDNSRYNIPEYNSSNYTVDNTDYDGVSDDYSSSYDTTNNEDKNSYVDTPCADGVNCIADANIQIYNLEYSELCDCLKRQIYG